MKKINFIKTLSIQEQYLLRRWAWFSFSIFVLLFVSIGALQIPQLILLQQTKQEYTKLTSQIKQVETRITQNQNLKNRMCCLGDQCTQLDKLACATQTPYTCIDAITSQCSDTIALQSCSLKNNTVEICAQCNNVQQAAHFVEQLAKEEAFANIQLVSLQPASENKIAFTAKGSINT